MILVIGATGTVGRELLRLLSGRGVQVRALVRHPEKAASIEAPGVEIVPGDLAQAETLNAVLKGIEKVFLLTPSSLQQVELEGNLVDAARRSGVKHIVKLSSLGARENSPIAMSRWHWQAEKLVKQSGIPYTFLRPQSFMQNLLAFAPNVRQRGIISAPMKDGRLSLVDARDVAAVAVVVLMEASHEGKTYRLSGPEALSFRDIADQLSSALNQQIIYEDIPEETARRNLLNEGWPPWLVEDQIQIYRYFSANRSPLVTDTIAKVAHKGATTFQEFARDYSRAFRK